MNGNGHAGSGNGQANGQSHARATGQDSRSGQELLAEFEQYGRQRPFEEIVRRYAGMVFNTCFRVTKDKHDAEDAAQAVFLTLAVQVKQGTQIKALGPWLQQVGKRLSLDLRRSKRRRKGREQRHHDEQTWRRTCADEQQLLPADLDEVKVTLHEELQKLPAKYRLPLVLHYFGGLDREAMAAELNCKPSTLGVRIFRGRALLAERLRERGLELEPAAIPLAIGAAVHAAVSSGMVLATGRAAAALAAGHDCAGLVSARVIALTRRTCTAVALVSKLKFAAMTLLIVCAALAAGSRAAPLLPPISASALQRVLVQQVQRLVRPLLQPLTLPRMMRTPQLPREFVLLPDGWNGPSAPRVPSHPAHAERIASLGVGWQVAPFVAQLSVPNPNADADQPAENIWNSWAWAGTVDRAVALPPTDAVAARDLLNASFITATDDGGDSADDSSGGDADSAEFADAESTTTVTAEAGTSGGGGAGSSAFTLVPPAANSSTNALQSDGEGGDIDAMFASVERSVFSAAHADGGGAGAGAAAAGARPDVGGAAHDCSPPHAPPAGPQSVDWNPDGFDFHLHDGGSSGGGPTPAEVRSSRARPAQRILRRLQLMNVGPGFGGGGAAGPAASLLPPAQLPTAQPSPDAALQNLLVSAQPPVLASWEQGGAVAGGMSESNLLTLTSSGALPDGAVSDGAGSIGAVPEPASLVLFGCGVASLLWGRRRRALRAMENPERM